jgi:hypothetical protein
MSLAIAKSPKIELNPSEYLEFVINKMQKTSTSNLSILNKSSQPVACRLKCSSPKDFQFRQDNLIIPARSSANIEVLYTYSINSYTSFHKFLLQTLIVKDENSIDWKGPGVHEYKLFAKFVDFKYLPKPPEPVVEPLPVEEKVVKVERFRAVKKCFTALRLALWAFFEFLARPRFNCFHLGFFMILGVLVTFLREGADFN